MTTFPPDPRSATTAAFDRLAAEYDDLTSGEIFQLLRQRTHKVFGRAFSAQSRVLEVGCGTGADTRFLAALCLHVVACDPSEEMVTRSLRRLARDGLETRATVMPCGLQDLQSYLDAIAPREPFDGIVSNFGAINCVSHLAPLGALVRRQLRPGGVVILGLMSRVCALEALYFAMTRRPGLAARRWGAGAVNVPVAGIDVPTFYHRVREVREALGRHVRLTAVHGIGVVIPPPFLEPRWRSLPNRLRSVVTKVDEFIAPWPPFNRVGDHVLLQFKKDAGHA
jgi:SAM-dependent methyltransferase